MSVAPPPVQVPPTPKPPKPPGKVGPMLKAAATWPRRLSLPARAAWLLGLALVVIIVCVWLVFLTSPDSVPWQFTLTVRRVVLVSVLTLLIPLVFYATLQLWMRGEVSPFPDVDYAWKAGLDALRRHGLSVDRIPIFLVLGSSSEQQEQVLMDASKLSFRVRGVPDGPAPLHWYANPERIYLFCSEASWMSALSVLAERRGAERAADAAGTFSGPATEFVDEPPVPAPPVEAPAHRGTMMLTQLTPASRGAAPAVDPRETPSAPAARGTMVFQSPLAGAVGDEGAWGPHGGLSRDLPAVLTSQESSEQLERLRYVCQLLRNARDPLCPINGILALIPLVALQGSDAEVDEVQGAVRGDLTAARRILQLRCSVTALVVGMEREPGFRELVRRVGRERAAEQRFGQRFDTRGVATSEELAALAVHVGGAFEDWIYMLFREQGALTRPGNTRLYSLLCKVRSQLQARLTDVLADGFGCDTRYQSPDEAMFFSGCYFAATGDAEDRQAFVRGVLDKLDQEQEQVEWTAGALSADRRYRRLTYAACALIVLLTLSLTAGIVALNVE